MSQNKPRKHPETKKQLILPHADTPVGGAYIGRGATVI